MFEKITSDICWVIQDRKESVKDYVNRFGMEALSIPNIDMATVIEAFKTGFKKDPPFMKTMQ